MNPYVKYYYAEALSTRMRFGRTTYQWFSKRQIAVWKEDARKPDQTEETISTYGNL